ncbi:MAG TPA: hypothetical protein VMF35_02370 [Acidimicrobiales bacterium]|nr:hypothetical protein [Acidimicrobiales bacterium]
MRNRVVAAAAAVLAASTIAMGMTCSAGGSETASRSSGDDAAGAPIRVGIPYVDLSAVRKYGVTLDHGNYPDAYNALVANLNAHGGIDGRRVVPYLVAVNPVGTAPAASACTQLAADDKVFVAFAPQQPDCFLDQYGIPTINGVYQGVSTAQGAPNFTLQAPPLAYDPVQLAVFKRTGAFNGKKVGVFAGGVTDQREAAVVESSLKSLHVDVVDDAVDSAPTGDQAATYQDANVIAQRFRASGVNEVVAVGTGSLIWPDALQANQSTFNPPWVATNSGTVVTAAIASSIQPAYLKNMVTSSAVLDNYQTWHQAADQQCYQVVHRAYPDDKITPPSNPITGSDQSFYAVEDACDNLALFTAIAKAAGKDLTRANFVRAGYALHGASIPGSAVPVSFGPSRPYPLGAVYVGHYDATKGSVQFARSPS